MDGGPRRSWNHSRVLAEAHEVVAEVFVVVMLLSVLAEWFIVTIERQVDVLAALGMLHWGEAIRKPLASEGALRGVHRWSPVVPLEWALLARMESCQPRRCH